MRTTSKRLKSTNKTKIVMFVERNHEYSCFCAYACDYRGTMYDELFAFIENNNIIKSNNQREEYMKVESIYKC